MQPIKLRNIIIAILGLAIVVNLVFLSTGQLSAREVGLLSTILAVVSIATTWIIAHIYSESSHEKAIQEVKDFHQSNMKTYALNAAEKVNNISVQLDRLSVYLQEGLDDESYESPKDSLRARVERIESAIHILQTLKSVNDTSLNDWKGVIGEELEEQREAREEREEELRNLIERVAQLETAGDMQQQPGDAAAVDKQVRAQLAELRRELRILVSGVTGSHVRPSTRRTNRTKQVCPDCNHNFEYAQNIQNDNI